MGYRLALVWVPGKNYVPTLVNGGIQHRHYLDFSHAFMSPLLEMDSKAESRQLFCVHSLETNRETMWRWGEEWFLNTQILFF